MSLDGWWEDRYEREWPEPPPEPDDCLACGTTWCTGWCTPEVAPPELVLVVDPVTGDEHLVAA